MKLLTVKEISEMLQVKPSTIYVWTEQRLIPHFKLNGALRFSETEILTWIKNCKKERETHYNDSAGRRPGKGGLI